MALINDDFHPREQFRKIEYNDVEEFMNFRCELQDQRIQPLQKKINAYIQNVTNVKISFFICSNYSVPEKYIDILGTQNICPAFVIQETNPFYMTVANCESPHILSEYEMDPNLRNILTDFLNTTYFSNLKNCAIIPIIHPLTGKVSFHLGLANFDPDPVNHKKIFGVVKEVFNYTVGLISNTFAYEEERRHHEFAKHALSACFILLEEAANLEELNQELKKQLCDFFETERCYILILDNGKLVTKVELSGFYFDFGYEHLKDLSIPLGSGIQGKAAKSEKFISYAQLDKNRDPDFQHNKLHRLAALVPRNVLCFPMFYRGELFGVIELQNKIPTPIFTKLDEEYTVPFGIVCGYFLGKCLTLRRLENTRAAQFNGDTLLLRNLMSKQCDISKVILCDNQHSIDYDSFDFIPQQISEKHLECYCIKMLKESNFLDKYNIPFRTITWFLCTVRNGYTDLPFHNWYHAFAVFHYLYMMITKFELIEKKVFTPLEAFAILIAALCHDLELKGSTSRYQPIRGAVIASLYSSPGSVEKRFSANQTIRLFSIPETNILEEMGPNDYKIFIALINTLIISTDLWDHITKMSELKAIMEGQDFDRNNEDYKIYLFSLVMVAGDLCSYAKSWAFCKFTADQQYKEFYRFKDLYYAVNIFNLKNVSPNSKKFPHLQVQFMTDVCIPTFNYLQKMIPEYGVLYKHVEKNLAKFQNLSDSMVPEKTSVEDLLEKKISEELIPEPLKSTSPKLDRRDI